MSREAQLSVSLLVAIAAGDVFRAYLPPLWKLREAGGTAADPDLRGAEAHGIGFGLLIGGAASAVVRSPWPLVAAGLMVGAMFAQYEWAMQPDGPREDYA